MKCYGQRPRQFHQTACTFNVDSPVRMEQPKHNAIHPEFFRRGEAADHPLKCLGRVAEISTMRTDHHKGRNANLSANYAHQICCGRYTAGTQIFAQFDAVGSTTLGRECSVKSFDADFQ